MLRQPVLASVQLYRYRVMNLLKPGDMSVKDVPNKTRSSRGGYGVTGVFTCDWFRLKTSLQKH